MMNYQQSTGVGELFFLKKISQLARGGAGGGGRMESGDSGTLPSAYGLAHRGEAGWFQVSAQKAPAWERSSGIRERWDFFYCDHSDHSEEDEFSQMVAGGSGGSFLESQPSGAGLQLGESYGSERQVRGGLPQAAWRESRREIHWERANPMDCDGEGWCCGDFVAGLGTGFDGGFLGGWGRNF